MSLSCVPKECSPAAAFFIFSLALCAHVLRPHLSAQSGLQGTKGPVGTGMLFQAADPVVLILMRCRGEAKPVMTPSCQHRL